MWSIFYQQRFVNCGWRYFIQIWCGFDRASSLICGNKMPTRCNRGFIAVLIACSTCFGHHYAHHQELKSIMQWLLPVVFRAVVFKLLVWCGAEGCVSGNITGSNHCIILLSSWWWAWWFPKHVEQAIRSAIKTSVASSWHFISTYWNVNFFYSEWSLKKRVLW